MERLQNWSAMDYSHLYAAHVGSPQPLASLPFSRSVFPPSNDFWKVSNVAHRLRELQNTCKHAEALKKELETLLALSDDKFEMKNASDDDYLQLSSYLENRGIDIETQASATLDAANALILDLKSQLEPFRPAVSQDAPWEEKSSVVRFFERRLKSKRNKRWRKRKKQRIAEILAKKNEEFVKADREADEWRCREMSKETAKLKVEKMKEIAKIKAKEEKKKLESELELIMIVEKLKELRSIRVEKLKKHGHFLPEEDDKFLDKVRASVEEEERQARETILNAEEYLKPSNTNSSIADKQNKSAECSNQVNSKDHSGKSSDRTDEKSSAAATTLTEETASINRISRAYETLSNLPDEFYHYYHGSNNDLGTLIEVRRTWDAYIKPGGSRIPWHWVEPPAPSSDVWASYLVRPGSKNLHC